MGNQLWWRKTAVILPLLLAAGGVMLWGALRSPLVAFDDAFITYRYAQNLRDGLGLVYNPGEWVLGTTAPLFALLLAGLGLVVADIAWLGHWLSILAWLAGSLGAWALLRQAGRAWAGALAGLLLAALPVMEASIGMESALLVALMLWTAWSWGNGRFWLTVFLGALLILTRQDSALWLLFLGLEMWRRKRIFPWREGVATAVFTLPWFLYTWQRYGSPLPNSAAAKIGQQAVMPVEFPSFYHSLWLSLAAHWPLLLAISFAALVLLGLGVIFRRARQLWWLVGWLTAYIVIYSLLQVVSFTWYFVPPAVVIVMIAALGLGALLGDDGLVLRGRWRWATAVVGLLLAAWLLGQQVATLWQRHQTPIALHRYHEIGQWLAANSDPADAVLTIEIGIVGYHSRRPIVDPMGLVSEEMTRHQLGWAETLVYALNSYRPEYALVLPDTAWNSLKSRWWFAHDYRPVAEIRGAQIYKRNQAAALYEATGPPRPLAHGLTISGAQFASQTITPGEPLTAWIEVEAAQTPPENFDLALFLVDAVTQEFVTSVTLSPFDGLYATGKWQVGDRLSVPVQLPLPAAIEPGTYQLGVQFRERGRDRAISLPDNPDVEAPPVRLGWLRTAVPPTAPSVNLPTYRSLAVSWQNGIQLTGLSTLDLAVKTGENWPLQLDWCSGAKIARNWKLFLHLVDDAGNIVAQLDEYPGNGRWLTAVWQTDECFPDRHTIPLPADLQPGVYHLRLGFYDEQQRLPLADSQEDFILLPAILEIAE